MVSVSCLSLISSVGYTPQSAATALRAGASAFGELAYRDRDGENVIGAKVAEVPDERWGQERIATLANLAFEKVPAQIAETWPWDRMPFIVCAPERQRPGPRLSSVGASSWSALFKESGPARAMTIEAGPTSTFEAIHLARRALANPDVPACLVFAVDSLIDARVLAWLAQAFRLKTADQTDGVIPSEAACLSIVSRQPLRPTSVTVKGLGLAQETATVLNEEPLRGNGFADALRQALKESGLEMHHVDFRISDVAGESYAFEELVLALSRVMRQVKHSQPLWHPADSVGDCGAVAGLIQIAWAEHAFAQGYAPGPIAALHGSSAFGARAAAIVAPTERLR